MNLVGKTYDRLTVLAPAPGRYMWRCRCNGLQGRCGKIVTCTTSRLRSGGTKSCGCASVVDLTGKRFGSFVVLHRVSTPPNRNGCFWQVRCEEEGCGKEYPVVGSNLKTGQRNCGCNRRSRRPHLVGERFGLLTVDSFVGRAPLSGAAIWKCRCACTGAIELTTASLFRVAEPNCGCLRWQILHRRKHGNWHRHTRARNGLPSFTYISWHSMVERCSSKTSGQHGGRYFDRGIRVCARWRGPKGFVNFLSDMGERPPGMTLDRFPNRDGNYEPGNCRWATPRMQAQNRETPKELRGKIEKLERRIKKLERSLASSEDLKRAAAVPLC